MTEETRVSLFVGVRRTKSMTHSPPRYCNSTDPFSETKCEFLLASYESAFFLATDFRPAIEENSSRRGLVSATTPSSPCPPLLLFIVDLVLTILSPRRVLRESKGIKSLLLESLFIRFAVFLKLRDYPYGVLHVTIVSPQTDRESSRDFSDSTEPDWIKRK